MTTKSDVISKNFPITFNGFARVWYHGLKPNSILGHIPFQDLYMKLISHLSTNIHTKKSTTELFAIIQQDDESMRAYF